MPADSNTPRPKLRWLVIGTGEIAADFVQNISGAVHSTVSCVVGSQQGRSQPFVESWKLGIDAAADTVEDALGREDIDAVYIATPHPSHEALAIAAIEAGKAVLVEKPIALSAKSAERIVEAAIQSKVLLMEAYMYRCHPVIAKLVEMLRQGTIGEVRHIESNFCFKAPFDPTHRLFNPELGGGAILDVGGYPASLSCLIAGLAEDSTYAVPRTITASGVLGQTGVEEDARAELVYASGIKADLRCAIGTDAGLSTTITGEQGTIQLPDPWLPGGDRKGRVSRLVVHRVGEAPGVHDVRAPASIYGLEAEMVAGALGRAFEPSYPAMSHADTISNMRLLDAWRDGVRTSSGTASHLHLHT